MILHLSDKEFPVGVIANGVISGFERIIQNGPRYGVLDLHRHAFFYAGSRSAALRNYCVDARIGIAELNAASAGPVQQTIKFGGGYRSQRPFIELRENYRFICKRNKRRRKLFGKAFDNGRFVGG
jgi:sugar (pentulose or hexulose) kinase